MKSVAAKGSVLFFLLYRLWYKEAFSDILLVLYGGTALIVLTTLIVAIGIQVSIRGTTTQQTQTTTLGLRSIGELATQSAYYTNRYEMEAYGNEHRPEYWKNYNRTNLRGKYTIKNRKSTYRTHRDNWKEFCKSL